MFDEFRYEAQRRKQERVRKQNQRLNEEYRNSLQDDFSKAMNQAFAGVNEELKQRKKENEEKSLLNTGAFVQAFNESMKDSDKY